MIDAPEVFRQVVRRGSSFPMEQDRIPGFFVITAWPGESVVLRIRVQHHANDERCPLYFELRMKEQPDFEVLATAEASVYDILGSYEPVCGCTPLQHVPEVWRREFLEMLQRWAACSWILEYGSVTEVRYGVESGTDRDCLAFPPARASAAMAADGTARKPMAPVQRRVIEAIHDAPFEEQVPALGFALVCLLATHCESPISELERLFVLMRKLITAHPPHPHER